MPVLETLCDLIVDCEHKTAPPAEDGEYPLIRTPDIGLGRLLVEKAQRVTAETYKAWTKRAVPGPGDLILAREAPVGNVGIVRDGIQPVLGQRTVLIRPDASRLDPFYLNYLLSGPALRGWMEGVSIGATVPHLNMADIRSMALPPLPPLPTQRKIAAILCTYDDLIENNTRRINLLEEMAQRIYREWFVDFRYPGHEDVPLVDSEIGPIPRGWAATNLGSVGKWFSGGTPSTASPEYWGGGVPWITSGSLQGRYLSRSDRTLTPAGVQNGSRLVPRDTILFVVRGMSLAKEFRVGIAECDLAFGQDCKAVQVSDPVVPLLILHYLSDRAPQIAKMVEFAAHGTGKISTDRLMALPIPLPPRLLQTKFEELAATIRQLVTGLNARAANLRATRDFLLPRLISGEIDVEHLDIQVPEAA